MAEPIQVLPIDDPAAPMAEILPRDPLPAPMVEPALPQDPAPAPLMELPPKGAEEIPFSKLSAEDQKSIQDQLSQPEPEGVDMVGAMTPQELADIFIESKGKDFNPAMWAAAHPDATPEQTDKVADAWALVKERGSKFSDIDWKEAGHALWSIFPGAAKYTGRALELSVVSPVGRLVSPKLTGGAQEEFEASQAAKSAELTAATEAGMFGIGSLIKKGAKVIGKQIGKVIPDAVQDFLFLPSFSAQFLKSPLDQTPQERRDALWEAAGEVTQHENIAKGHGAVTGTLLAGPIKDLEARGYKVDPEVVSAMAAGDPITFYAFGKGFQVAVAGVGGTAKVIANVASKSEAGQLVVALNTAQRAAAKAGATERQAAGAAATGLEAELAGGAQIGKTAFPGQAGTLTVEASPGLSAALDTAAETAAAARAAEVAARAAGAAVQASRGARGLTVAGKIPAAVVEAKELVATAISGVAERGIDKVVALAPGVAGVGLKAASWVAKVAGEHPLAAYAIAGGGTAGLGGAGAVKVGQTLAPGLARAATGATAAAKQLVKGDVSKYGSTAAAISSAAQMFPAIAGGMARGAVVDASLAAATSETSEDMAHAPMFMTAHGALRGASRGVLSGVQRQLIGERDIQSATRTANRAYGTFENLDAANKFTVEQLSKNEPDKVRRLSAIRDFLNPSGAQIYWIPEAGEVTKVLQQYKPGLTSERYAEMAAQRALYIEIDGKKVAIVKDLDAAPHEAMHPWQEVMSEKAMEVVDQIVYDEYAPHWEAIGENYARKFFGSEYVSALKAKGEGWREAIVDLATGKTGWREQLTPEEVQGFADQYIAREISAEVGDSIFKQGGPEMLQDKGLPGKIARIIAKTYSWMGMEPFQGVRTEGQGIPLQFEATGKIREALTGGIEKAKVELARPDLSPKPTVSPKGPVSRRGETAPIREQADPVAAAREIADAAPTTPTIRGGRSQQEIATDIADAIENGTGLSVDYMSAPGEPAGAITSNRAARREIIEAFRNMPPEARVLWEKNFFPDQVVRAGSKVQVMGWSPEVFAANAHKLAAAITKKPGGIAFPYELDPKTGTFTERGWKELFVDTTNFVANQRAALTGAGEPLVVPQGVVEKGFTAPRAEGEAGAPLDQRKADIISALFGVPIPKTPRVGAVYPRNLAGQEVSAATKPGRVSVPVEPRAPFAGERAEEMGVSGRTLQEVNPFRAELEAAGIKPSFIEALQRLNLENIADVSALPAGTPEIRGREFTLQAGFQPMEREPRAIKMAAIRMPSGKIFEGAYHGDAINKAELKGHEDVENSAEMGFTTNGGEFLGREAALERAQSLKQISARDARIASSIDEGLEAVGFEMTRKFQPGEGKGARLEELKKLPVRTAGEQAEFESLNAQELAARQAAKDRFRQSMVEAGMKFQPKPNEEVKTVADTYAKSSGVTYKPSDKILDVNPDVAKKLADFYEAAKDSPTDPEVRGSYLMLKRETVSQWGAIQRAGYTLEPWTGKGEPYKNSAEMLADVKDNKHLYFLKTEGNFEGAKNNPMLQPSPVEGLLVNDIFRAVHDFFGHSKEGYQFGPKGELNAWRAHSEMYSPEAQGALAAETLAQNSWVNFGKHLRDSSGNVPAKGGEGYVPPASRPFAEQKAIVIPKELIDEARGGEAKFSPKYRDDQISSKSRRNIAKQLREDAARYEADGDGILKQWAKDAIAQAEMQERMADEMDSSAKFAPKKGDELKLKPTSGSPSKAWIMPDGKVETFGAQFHGDWLQKNPDVREKFKLELKSSGDIDMGMREAAALRAGFARVNYEPRNGKMTVEARAKDWPKVKDTVFDMVEKNLGEVDKLEIHLLDEKVNDTPVDSVFGNLFQLNTTAEKLAKVQEVLDDVKTGGEVEAPAGKGPSNIAIARARFQPEEKKDASFRTNMRDLSKRQVERLGYDYGDLSEFPIKRLETEGSYVDFEEGPRSLNVLVAGTKPAFRGQGRMKALLNELHDYAKENDLRFDEGSYTEMGEKYLMAGVERLKAGGRFSPRGETEGLPGFDLPREVLTAAGRANMTRQELREHFPEALVPRANDESLPSKITSSPLYKAAASEADAVKSFAKRIVEFARENENDPLYVMGTKWYSDFTPKVKKAFGKDAQVMVELLAATSPQTNPEVNFGYAFDAMQSLKAGRFDKIIPKFEEGLAKMEDGSWEKWYSRNTPAEGAPESPTPASFMAAWINKFDLKPRQSNGKLYGQHSRPVLEVLARNWIEANAGPKTKNFVENLMGKSHEATIDLWADRTMRWAGYEGFQDRWRILPENVRGVVDEDFAFAQKTFSAAAKELGIKPDALQGGLWFAEKKRWADNGWGRLDLGSFQDEMVKVPALRKKFEQRMKLEAATKKKKPAEQLGFDIESRFE